MKKYILFALLLFTFLGFGQELPMVNSSESYNKWSIEINVGQNKAVRPFAPGYYSSNPNKFIDFTGTNHYDVGLRYMLSESFGLKLDYSNEQFSNLHDAGSLPFETHLNRVGLQGVINVGRLVRFESFTSRIGLLGHAGIQVSKFQVIQGMNSDLPENNGGVMFGLTPQVRITDWLSLTADFTVVNNVRQHLNWDGSNAISDSNLSGILYTTSLGLTVYLGKNKKHADWFTDKERVNSKLDVDLEARKRLDEIEVLLNDTDRDGIPDYRDAENNTPAGIAVDAKGRFIDLNNNQVPDEMERSSDSSMTNDKDIVRKQDVLQSLVENGYINVYFDVNKAVPNTGSTNNMYQIIAYLRLHPEVKATLKGYTDLRGDEATNLDLSKRRAQRVFDIITAAGIDASRVTIAGEGVDASYTNTTTGFDLARRVSISINNK